MDNRQCLVLIRGQKPLKGEKIIPDELAGYAELTLYPRGGVCAGVAGDG